MENSILDTHREEFQRLLGHIAADMELQPQLVPSASTANEGYERLLPLVATLNAKQSGLVNGKIVEVIAQQATRPR